MANQFWESFAGGVTGQAEKAVDYLAQSAWDKMQRARNKKEKKAIYREYYDAVLDYTGDPKRAKLEMNRVRAGGTPETEEGYFEQDIREEYDRRNMDIGLEKTQADIGLTQAKTVTEGDTQSLRTQQIAESQARESKLGQESEFRALQIDELKTSIEDSKRLMPTDVRSYDALIDKMDAAAKQYADGVITRASKINKGTMDGASMMFSEPGEYDIDGFMDNLSSGKGVQNVPEYETLLEQGRKQWLGQRFRSINIGEDVHSSDVLDIIWDGLESYGGEKKEGGGESSMPKERVAKDIRKAMEKTGGSAEDFIEKAKSFVDGLSEKDWEWIATQLGK